jgi:hypothetical protein
MRQGSGKVYRIVVRSELSKRYATAFEGMEMEVKSGRTILTGEVIDQPHLYGILDRISGLGPLGASAAVPGVLAGHCPASPIASFHSASPRGLV